jgi:hypothetical protein
MWLAIRRLRHGRCRACSIYIKLIHLTRLIPPRPPVGGFHTQCASVAWAGLVSVGALGTVVFRGTFNEDSVVSSTNVHSVGHRLQTYSTVWSVISRQAGYVIHYMLT